MRLCVWLFSTWRQMIVGLTLFVVLLIAVPLPARAIGSTELITLTNIERTKNGLAPLAYNGRLAASAYAKAKHMLTNGYWAHNAPDGTTPWSFVSQAGYAYVNVGENLARDFPTDEATIAGWMASAGHRANILKAEYKDIGIAAISGTMNGEPITLVVAHYGATASTNVRKNSPTPAVASSRNQAEPTTKPAPVAPPQPQVMKQAHTPVTEKGLNKFLRVLGELLAEHAAPTRGLYLFQ